MEVYMYSSKTNMQNVLDAFFLQKEICVNLFHVWQHKEKMKSLGYSRNLKTKKKCEILLKSRIFYFSCGNWT